jgi:hypothetical protein
MFYTENTIMANANRSREKTYVLAESQLNAIEIALEQIEGLADLIQSHSDGVTSDVGAMSALNIIREKAQRCAIVLRAGYAEQPKAVLTMVSNLRRRR